MLGAEREGRGVKVIAGPASQLLACRIARDMGVAPSLVEFRRFPDGEAYTRILDDIEGSVAIVQSTQTDQDFVALLQLIDACGGAEQVNVVIPYMGYARQDKQFKRGEPVSIRAMARAIPADNVFTINIHDEGSMQHFGAKASNLNAAPLIGRHIASLGLSNPVLIAPDDGALYLAKSAANDLGIDFDYLEKTRHSGDAVTVHPRELDVRDRDVIIIDDIISTGGTVAEAAALLKQQGALDVYVAAVHAVLANNAILRLFSAGIRDIIATDTLDQGSGCVSVAPLVASALGSL